MIILAIDPGIRSAGVSLFATSNPPVPSASVLRAVARITLGASERSDEVVENERMMAQKIAQWANARGHRIDLIVSERPQIYQRRGGKSKADPNDQLPMVGVTAAVATRLPFARVKTYRPAEWKGQLPKDVTLRRVIACLAPDERALLEAAGKATDPGESVGVGLHHLGRFRVGRVYPGASQG